MVHADAAAGPVALRLPGTQLEVSCTVQALSDEDYAYALEVLATTRADDVPAPQPLTTAPKAVPEPPEHLPEAAAPAAPAAVGNAGPAQAPASLMAQFALYDDSGVPEAYQTPKDPKAPGGEALEADPEDAPGLGESTPPTTPPARLPDPVEPAADVVLPAPHLATASADEPDPDDGTEDEVGNHPMIRVLGPVEVEGAQGTVESKRKRTSIELAAWLVLHPGLDHRALDEAMWPGRETARKYRNASVSRLRTWLGADNYGKPYLPPIATTSDARYALAPTVDCDWNRFQHLVQTAATGPGPQAAAQLRAALALVRGRPFSGVGRRRYAWAEHQAQDMISAIVDAAADLAEHYLTQGDPRDALWAATKGLDAAPEMENLYRILFRAYAALGDYDALERAAGKLDDLNMALGVDMEEPTTEILAQLSKSA
ncbi:BTAD domain-containing putative transcriptional regulator [Streptomyces chattanoogensis]